MNIRAQFDDRRESSELPGLVNAYSTSSGSQTSGSPTNADLSNLSRRSRKRSNPKSDNSILRGAEILRRQLHVLDGVMDDEQALQRTNNDRKIHESKKQVEYGHESQLDHDWSNPWRVDPWSDPRVTKESLTDEVVMKRTRSPYEFPARGDAASWAHLDDDDDDTAMLLMRATDSLTTPRAVSPDHTPETFMGRDGKLRAKVQTYIVQRVDDIDSSTLESSYNSEYQPTRFGEGGIPSYLPGGLVRQHEPTLSALGHSTTPRGSPTYATTRKVCDDEPATHCNPLELLKDLQDDEEALQELADEQDELTYLLKHSKRDPNVCMMALPTKPPSPCDHVVSPSAPEYAKFMKDPAFLHAQRAGTLWQSLVSQHVRFPSKWWNGARSPPMGAAERRLWQYTGRHRVPNHPYLNGTVHNRGSAGRLLLHIIVRDIMTMDPVHDIAIGCFHPNARGVRTTSAFDPTLEESRDVWLAIRRRVDESSVVESLIKQSNEPSYKSPLGAKNAVNNTNMRAVFGENPPQHTLFVVESDLYEIFSQHVGEGTLLSPATILLQHFLPGW